MRLTKPSWLFKKLNLSLRAEVIINISLLMCAAIFLIGFTTSKIIGGIQIEVSLGDVMRRLLEAQRMILILITLDAIVLIVFGSFLLSRVLVKPMKDLVRLTQKISEGDFSQTIEVTSTNEIGQLISSFNRMLERLKKNQENIKEHLESLELANRKLKQAQEELIRTEKLASIGRFAAGVAHEVGNPLGSILGYTSILGQEGVSREESKDYLKRIEKEIERINRIVQDLLNFARPSKFEIQEVEINKVIKDTLSLLSYQKNIKNIETQIALHPNLPIIKGDESQLSQVFINVILNAIDAMPNGGLLGIQTEEYVVEELLVDHFQPFQIPRRKDDPMESDYSHLRNPDPLSTLFTPLESPAIYGGDDINSVRPLVSYGVNKASVPHRKGGVKAPSFLTGFTKFSKGDRLVKIRISDTGIGIKKEDLEKIFDPFFTTKDPDKGTGLGLSISLRIVESLGGEMKVESEIGKGSTFEIYFPVATHGGME